MSEMICLGFLDGIKHSYTNYFIHEIGPNSLRNVYDIKLMKSNWFLW